MSGLNKVMILGNLGDEGQLRMTPGGAAVLKFTVACSESFLDKNRQRQERTEWVKCVVWGARAEALAKILHKGSRVHVEGSLRTSSYDDRDGNKRYTTEVNVQNVILCGGARGEQRDGGGQRTGDYDENQSKGRAVGESYDTSAAPPDDDDIPF